MHAVTLSNSILVKTPLIGEAAAVSVLPGAQLQKQGHWQIPKTPLIAQMLCLNAMKLDFKLSFDAMFELLSYEAVQMNKLDGEAAKKLGTKSFVGSTSAKTPMWHHQARGFQFAIQKRAALLAMDMGTGKSKVAIDLCNARKSSCVVILCPKSVAGVWIREFKKHSKAEYFVENHVLGNTKKAVKTIIAKERLHWSHKRSRVHIINHESAWRKNMAEALKKLPIDCLIVDECHRAKDPRGRFSNFCYELSLYANFVLGLTGTPMPHSPLDIFAQFRFLDCAIFGLNSHRFQCRYAETAPLQVGGRTINRVIGMKNEAELNKEFYRLAYRVTKEEALDLPDKSFQSYPLELSDLARPIYDDMEEWLTAEIESGRVTAANCLAKTVRLRQIATGFAQPEKAKIEQVSTHKFAAILDILTDAGEPVVFFCNFKPEIALVEKAAKKLDLKYGEISGRTHDLTEHSEMPEGIQAMAVMMKSGGVGIDLTRSALGCYVSPTFSLGDFEQSISRMHRPGQEQHTRFIRLETRGTIEPIIYKALSKRRNVIETVINYGKKKHESDTEAAA
jgi:SNF2 family DNA or RNA helicase